VSALKRSASTNGAGFYLFRARSEENFANMMSRCWHGFCSSGGLNEIKELLKLDRTQDRARIRALAQSRLTVLEAKIADFRELIASLKGLIHHCAAAPKTVPCPIVEAFGASVHSRHEPQGDFPRYGRQ
jgi:hypothetical protein